MNKNRVVVRILGEEYAIKGSAGAEHIRRVASELDARLSRLAQENPRLGPGKLAVLAALNLVEELQQSQEQYRRLLRMAEKDWGRRQHGGKAD